MRIKLLLLTALITFSTSVYAQQGNVQQSGSVSAGHGVQWITNGVVGDSGNALLKSPVPVSNGGTGLTTLPAGSILLGNGTSNPTFIAPSVNGDCLTVVDLAWALAPCGTTPPTTGALLIGGDTTSCLLIGGDSTSCLLVN